MKHTRCLTAVAVAMLMSTGPVWADASIQEAAASPEYTRKAGGMIGRGLLNVSTCFMDLLVHTVNETMQSPPLIGTVLGMAKGAGCSVLRAGSGVIDVTTFWVPGFNGFPASESYGDCLAYAPSVDEASPADERGSEMEGPVAPSGASGPSAPQPEKPRYSK